GADVVQHNRVLGIRPGPEGGWRLDTELGPVAAEHVVNAGGLWARRVGRMVGVDHPVVPMQHHYLVTEAVPEIAGLTQAMPAVTDLEGHTYLQREGDGALLGVYETNPAHGSLDGADWDFGMTLLPPDIDRIAPELEIGFRRFPALARAGIKRWVNGAFTFTPDGNPLVGPVRARPGYWAACGVMAGFSQGAAIGLALSNWIVDGDPGDDVFAMDVARFGDWAADDAWLRATTAQFYARRFVIGYPGEALPAGRPLRTTPAYDELRAAGARFDVTWGLEVPQFFADDPGFVERYSLRRSNAFDLVAREVAAVRSAVGAYETGHYARYEVTGRDASRFLDRLLASRLPAVGRVRMAPMLAASGRLLGDFTLSRLAEDRWWLIGSYHLQEWHLRWFDIVRAEFGAGFEIEIDNLSDRRLGFALSGPATRDLVGTLTDADIDDTALPFMSCRLMEVAGLPAMVARLSVTGEFGVEITVAAEHHRHLWRSLRAAGTAHGLRPIGDRAVDSLRLEKGYGVWSADFTQAMTPQMTGLDRFVDWSRSGFVGEAAARAERETPTSRRLVLLDVAARSADAVGEETVRIGDRPVGYVTSGSFGHHVERSLALACVDREASASGEPVSVAVLGDLLPATILDEPPYDPAGERLRG
ncbi:MAG: GcvT family protein, partial [Nocardioides sp.]